MCLGKLKLLNYILYIRAFILRKINIHGLIVRMPKIEALRCFDRNMMEDLIKDSDTERRRRDIVMQWYMNCKQIRYNATYKVYIIIILYFQHFHNI